MDEKALIAAAQQARRFARAPYSHFAVGAALCSAQGKIYTGCNIESAAFSPTMCAERTALVKALSEGETEFAALAVVGGAEGTVSADYTSPCGVCRQMLFEYCPAEMPVFLYRSDGQILRVTVQDLLPLGFGKNDIL